MKKPMLFLLAMTLLVSVAGCKNQSTPSSVTTEETNASVTIEEVYKAPETDASQFVWEEAEDGVRITDYTGEDAIVVIPSTIEGQPVVALSGMVFSQHETLEALRTGANTVRIEDSLLGNCDRFHILVCDDALRSIAQNAFLGATTLSEVVLNEGLTEIGFDAFLSTGLSEVTIPESVVSEKRAFYPKDSDSTITIHVTKGSVSEAVYSEVAGDATGIIVETIS